MESELGAVVLHVLDFTVLPSGNVITVIEMTRRWLNSVFRFLKQYLQIPKLPQQVCGIDSLKSPFSFAGPSCTSFWERDLHQPSDALSDPFASTREFPS